MEPNIIITMEINTTSLQICKPFHYMIFVCVLILSHFELPSLCAACTIRQPTGNHFYSCFNLYSSGILSNLSHTRSIITILSLHLPRSPQKLQSRCTPTWQLCSVVSKVVTSHGNALYLFVVLDARIFHAGKTASQLYQQDDFIMNTT